MISTTLAIIMCLGYLAIAVAAAYERYWPWVFYYMGAVSISIGVIWMRWGQWPNSG